MKLFIQELDKVVQTGLEQGSWDVPRNVYLWGGASAPYAQLTLDEPLPTNVTFPAGTLVVGRNSQQQPVQGTLLETAPEGATVLQVSYEISSDPEDYVQCRVGGLVPLDEQDLSGCEFSLL